MDLAYSYRIYSTLNIQKMKNAIIIGAILLAAWYFFFKKKAVSLPAAQAINPVPTAKEVIKKVNDFLIAPEPSLVNPAKQITDNIKNLVEQPVYTPLPEPKKKIEIAKALDPQTNVTKINVLTSGITDAKVWDYAIKADAFRNSVYSLADQYYKILGLKEESNAKMRELQMSGNTAYVKDGTWDAYNRDQYNIDKMLEPIMDEMLRQNKLNGENTNAMVAQIEISSAESIDKMYSDAGLPNPYLLGFDVVASMPAGALPVPALAYSPVPLAANVPTTEIRLDAPFVDSGFDSYEYLTSSGSVSRTPVPDYVAYMIPATNPDRFSNIIDQSQLESLASDPFALKQAQYYQNDSLLF